MIQICHDSVTDPGWGWGNRLETKRIQGLVSFMVGMKYRLYVLFDSYSPK